jgi:hypothetical protein
MTVESPIGFRLGFVKRRGNKYTVLEAGRNPLMLVRSRYTASFCCFPSVNKHVVMATTLKGVEIGHFGFVGNFGPFKNSQSFGVTCKSSNPLNNINKYMNWFKSTFYFLLSSGLSDRRSKSHDDCDLLFTCMILI